MRLPCSLLLCLLCLARARSIHGSIDVPSDDIASNLVIAVASAADGAIVETVPIISSVLNNHSFELHTTAAKNGRYLVSVFGSVAYEYSSVVATVHDSTLIASFARESVTHALVYPAEQHVGENAPSIQINALRRTRLARSKANRFGSVSDVAYFVINLPSYVWRNKLYIAASLAVFFILWFPHVFHKLPKEMREELSGEKEADLGDPNKVLKALLGDDAFSVKKKDHTPSPSSGSGPR